MTDALEARIAHDLARDMHPCVRAFAQRLGEEAGALAVLFYGSNLRTGALDGVLDYYVLLPGKPEKGVWPRVSYREWRIGQDELRAKIATMTLARFAEAASGKLLDTTIWARFVQPAALAWHRDANAVARVVEAVSAAAVTAARLAAALGPERAAPDAYWTALFEATYKAEFRIEKASRAQAIITVHPGHFPKLLPLALDAAGIGFDQDANTIAPQLDVQQRAAILRWWRKRRRLGKGINVIRLLRAAFTFDGAARYAAWKIERHSGVAVKLTPWRERHPVLAAPAVLFAVWRARRRAKG